MFYLQCCELRDQFEKLLINLMLPIYTQEALLLQHVALSVHVGLDDVEVVVGEGQGVEDLAGTELRVALHQRLHGGAAAVPEPQATHGDAGALDVRAAVEDADFAPDMRVRDSDARERLLGHDARLTHQGADGILETPHPLGPNRGRKGRAAGGVR